MENRPVRFGIQSVFLGIFFFTAPVAHAGSGVAAEAGGKMLDDTYDAFASYWAMSLGIRPEAIQARLTYLDEKQFPQARNADPKVFLDNSFVEALDKTWFLQKFGMRQ